MVKIVLKNDRSAERELTERARRMVPCENPSKLSELERSVHFLRGVKARSTLALPAFYLFHAAAVNTDRASSIEGYPGVVFKHSVGFSALGTVTLVCRKAFDHGMKGDLTGSKFAKTSDNILERHAEYWAKSSSRTLQDAYSALCLLRSVFRDCSKTDAVLLKGINPLGRRIGLLKQYADRSAAHLTFEDYAITALDCAHVIAALTLIGEIVRSFDDSSLWPTYFDALDEAGFSAAKQLFPATSDFRLFQHMKIEMQARSCWQMGIERGRQMLFEQLPYAIRWY